jgi:predicted transposase YbfD/YdcC
VDGRLNKRMVGLLAARLPGLRLGHVPDPRRAHGRRWTLESLLRSVVVGLVAGKRSLREMEDLTAEMAPAARRVLGLRRRTPDTTMRDLLVRVSPDGLRGRIHAQIRDACRRKAIVADLLPFGVLSMDGKVTAIDAWGDGLAQRQRHGGKDGHGESARGLVRTVTSVLVSSRAFPVLDACPIPPETNEDGQFVQALDEVLAAYERLDLFRMVMYDSGACSLGNATAVRARHLHYTFRLDPKQPTLFSEAQRLLGARSNDEADTSSEDRTGRGLVRRYLFVTSEMAAFHGWEHLRTTLRVRSETWSDDGRLRSSEDRYYISSLAADRLSAHQWLTLTRLRWGVENQGHHTLDVAFGEDDHPWIRTNAKGMIAVLLLRRIACNLLSLFRNVSLRSEANRLTPWKNLKRWLYNALIGATEAHLVGLRPREEVTANLD